MSRLLCLLLAAGSALCGCAGGLDGEAQIAFTNAGEVASLDPAAITGIPEGKLARFLHEGLVIKHPRTLEPLPGVAESWTVSEDGLFYRFRLRPNARWSNGEAITAHDFVYSFERLLSPRTAAEYAYQLWYVRGGQRYTSETDERGHPLHSFESVGIRAHGDHELEIELEAPTPFFLDILGSVPLMPVHRATLARMQREHPDTWRVEWLKPENLVCSGPYVLEARRIADRVRLRRNPHYWDRESIAFETVDCLAVEHLNTMLNLYLTGASVWCDNLPSHALPKLVGRADFQPGPYLGVGFYRLNTRHPPLDDKRVRRALALCVPRAAIAARILGAGETPAWSFVPASARGHTPVEFTPERDAARNRAAAQALLAEAGVELPTLEILFATQTINKDVAEVIADGWRRDLGFRTKLSNQEARVALDSQKNLRYEISRSSWVGDHPDALGFLEIFRSDSVNNRTGWKHARYDECIDLARRARDPERAALLCEAETILMDELPIIPIWFFVTKNLVSPRLGGFHENALDEHFPQFWHWKDQPGGRR
jgi:oligopeptide transport system substrate-binding protein